MKDIALAIINESSWPIAILICFFFLRTEIKKFISKLKGVKAGTIEVLLTQELHRTNLTEKQLKAISSLSAEEIDLFLLVSYSENPVFTYELPEPREMFIKKINKLEETGLIIAQNTKTDEGRILHEMTPLGTQVRVTLLKGVQQLLQNSAS